MHKIPLAGVMTEFEVAPYFELGTVWPAPQASPAALCPARPRHRLPRHRAPQVVGPSTWGRPRRPNVFMDINYSF